MSDAKENIDALIDTADQLDEVATGLLAAAADRQTTPWWKAPFFKHGKFSKTATFATAANVITLGWYALSMFAGQELEVMGLSITIQKLDPALAAAVMGLANGTYLGNNALKSKTV